MGYIVSITAALVLWIVLWALGWKGQDAAVITVSLIVLFTVLRIGARYLPGRRA